jgi:hypothetical protein
MTRDMWLPLAEAALLNGRSEDGLTARVGLKKIRTRRGLLPPFVRVYSSDDAKEDRLALALDASGQDANTVMQQLPGVSVVALTPSDQVVMHLVGDLAMREEFSHVPTYSIRDELSAGTPPSQPAQSLDALHNHRLLDGLRDGRGEWSAVWLTLLGMEEYAGQYVPDYARAKRSAAAYLCTSGRTDSKATAASIGQSRFLVNHMVALWSHEDLVQAVWFKGVGENWIINSVEPELNAIACAPVVSSYAATLAEAMPIPSTETATSSAL